MKRYKGETLPKGCRIAVIANDALGNYAVATLPLQMLRARHEPSCLAFYCGKRIAELAEAETALFDKFVPLHGTAIRDSLSDKAEFDLVLNLESSPMSKVMAGLLAGESGFVCGPCVGLNGRGELPYAEDERGKLWEDKAWARASLARDYSFLDSGFIGEAFCRLAYLDGPVPSYQIASADPGRDVPDVLLAMSASLETKIWTTEGWVTAVSELRQRGLSVGLIGAKPKDQAQFWFGLESENELVASGLVEDLRGVFTLPQVVGALAKAKLVLSLDNGIMHFAVSTGTRTVGLFRHGIHWLWAPPSPNLSLVVGEPGEPVAQLSANNVLETIDRQK